MFYNCSFSSHKQFSWVKLSFIAQDSSLLPLMQSLDLISIPMWLFILTNQLKIISLVNYKSTNHLILYRLFQKQLNFVSFKLNLWTYFYSVLTRSLLFYNSVSQLNLHVLSQLLAFILSQDQTLFFYYYLIKFISCYLNN